MPKKSRKQKILASSHFQALIHNPSITISPIQTVKKPTVTAFSTTPTNESITARYFLLDLRKSIILILGIIALEIFFYFVSMRSDWIKLFKF